MGKFTTPSNENIRVSVSGTSGFALQQISLDRDNVDTLVNRYLVSRSYRYGFNGMEKDDEVAGNGNNYTAEFWQYDSRLGRRWNIDPVVKQHESPYAAFANNPIWFIDPNGDTIRVDNSILENKETYERWKDTKQGKSFLKKYGIGGEFEHISIEIKAEDYKKTGVTRYGSTAVSIISKKGGLSKDLTNDSIVNDANGLVKGENKTHYLKSLLSDKKRN